MSKENTFNKKITFSEKTGIYIHIPFCLSKCHYCDFVSFTNTKEIENYVIELCEEIKNAKIDFEIDTIFIGGGTPTILPIKLLEKIISEIFSNKIKEDYEFTIECNPETVDEIYLQNLINLGVNRISFGLQSCNNKMLNLLGRAHSYEKFLNIFTLARKVGFKNINIDLMYNLPNQTIEDWENTLNKVISLNPEHISAYSLIIEENTKFFHMLNKKIISIPSDEMYVKFNEICLEKLKKAGYCKYEVSNYSKVGFECKHNIIYWELDNYYGFGLNAHSKISNIRYSNTKILTDYLKGEYTVSKEILSKEDLEDEFIFLGLRKTNGISKKKYSHLFNEDFDKKYKKNIQYLLDENLLISTEENLYVTPKGFHILDSIILKILG